jgi:hypothetical protein
MKRMVVGGGVCSFGWPVLALLYKTDGYNGSTISSIPCPNQERANYTPAPGRPLMRLAINYENARRCSACAVIYLRMAHSCLVWCICGEWSMLYITGKIGYLHPWRGSARLKSSKSHYRWRAALGPRRFGAFLADEEYDLHWEDSISGISLLSNRGGGCMLL